MRGRLTFQWTQRPLLKILSSIKTKFMEEIQQEIGKQFSGDIERAMAPGTEVDKRIKEMIANEEIDLLDENRELILGNQISNFSNKNQQNPDDFGESANIRIDSPDPHKLDKAQLAVGEQQRSEVKDEVIKFVRQNSLLKEA